MPLSPMHGMLEEGRIRGDKVTKKMFKLKVIVHVLALLVNDSVHIIARNVIIKCIKLLNVIFHQHVRACSDSKISFIFCFKHVPVVFQEGSCPPQLTTRIRLCSVLICNTPFSMDKIINCFFVFFSFSCSPGLRVN